MGDISKNLSSKEAMCRCKYADCNRKNGGEIADARIVKMVQLTADFLVEEFLADKAIVNVISWCRCPKHNKDVGGKENSKHPEGKAMDFNIVLLIDGKKKQVSSEFLFLMLQKIATGYYFYKINDTNIHLQYNGG